MVIQNTIHSVEELPMRDDSNQNITKFLLNYGKSLKTQNNFQHFVTKEFKTSDFIFVKLESYKKIY